MNRIQTKLKRWSAAALLAMIAGGALAAPGDNGSTLPDGDNTKNLTKPGVGGVAGTGLGGSTGTSGSPAVPGTGESVKGPAGEGIGGQGKSDGISAGSNGK